MEVKKKGQGSLREKSDECLFCEIINGKVESYSVFEDKESFAFLDASPILIGHVLLVPRKHYSAIEEVPDNIVGTLFTDAKILSKALENGLNADGTLITMNDKVSQSKPHLHIHVIPRRFGDGFRGVFWPRHRYNSKEEAMEIQEKIRKALKQSGKT